jgi:serine/threonine protein kinase
VIGRVLSHYRIERPLGAGGGIGEVFLARDLALGRPAAIRVLSSSLSPDARDRLFREGEACARLQHPAIATFYEAGETVTVRVAAVADEARASEAAASRTSLRMRAPLGG